MENKLSVTYFKRGTHTRAGDEGFVVDLETLLKAAENDPAFKVKKESLPAIQAHSCGFRANSRDYKLPTSYEPNGLILVDLDAIGGKPKSSFASVEEYAANNAKYLSAWMDFLKANEAELPFLKYVTLSANNNLHLYCQANGFWFVEYDIAYKALYKTICETLSALLEFSDLPSPEMDFHNADPLQLLYISSSKLYVFNENTEPFEYCDGSLANVFDAAVSELTNSVSSVITIEGEDELFVSDLSEDSSFQLDLSRDGIEICGFSGNDLRRRIAPVLLSLFNGNKTLAKQWCERHICNRLSETLSWLTSASNGRTSFIHRGIRNYFIYNFSDFAALRDRLDDIKKEVVQSNTKTCSMLGMPKTYISLKSAHVSDYSDYILDIIGKQNLQLVALCGMGKTYFVKTIMQSKKCLVVNFLNSVNRAQYERDMYYVNNNFSSIDGKKSAAINIANLPKISNEALENFDYVFIDEIQKLIQDNCFRNFQTTVMQVVKRIYDKQKLVLLTGTPVNIENVFPNITTISLTKENTSESDIAEVNLYKLVPTFEEIENINNKKANKKSKRKTDEQDKLKGLTELSRYHDFMIRHIAELVANNNKCVVVSNRNYNNIYNMLCEAFPSNKVGLFSRNTAFDDTKKGILYNNRLVNDITVSTCYLTEGLDIKETEQDVHYIIYQTSERFSPVQIVQQMNRSRERKKIIDILYKDDVSFDLSSISIKTFDEEFDDLCIKYRSFIKAFTTKEQFIQYVKDYSHICAVTDVEVESNPNTKADDDKSSLLDCLKFTSNWNITSPEFVLTPERNEIDGSKVYTDSPRIVRELNKLKRISAEGDNISDYMLSSDINGCKEIYDAVIKNTEVFFDKCKQHNFNVKDDHTKATEKDILSALVKDITCAEYINDKISKFGNGEQLEDAFFDCTNNTENAKSLAFKVVCLSSVYVNDKKVSFKDMKKAVNFLIDIHNKKDDNEPKRTKLSKLEKSIESEYNSIISMFDKAVAPKTLYMYFKTGKSKWLKSYIKTFNKAVAEAYDSLLDSLQQKRSKQSSVITFTNETTGETYCFKNCKELTDSNLHTAVGVSKNYLRTYIKEICSGEMELVGWKVSRTKA